MPLVFDIETNGFLEDLDTIHCLNIYDLEAERHERYDPDNHPIDAGVKRLRDSGLIIGHNILGFDIPAIQKTHPGFEYNPNRIFDTMIGACCAFPDIAYTDWARYRRGQMPAVLVGKQTLEAWGYRLGIFKGEYGKTTDWKEWTPEMSNYCEQDVVVTLALFRLLQGKIEKGILAPEYVRLEQDFYWIIQRQIRRGVKFNEKKALDLLQVLLKEREELRGKLTGVFPPFYKKKGKLFTPKRDCRKRAGEWIGYVAGAPMQRIELVEFNPNSDQHIARMLMQRYDWIPEEFTDKDIPPPEIRFHYNRLGITAKTAPKVDDEILGRLPYPEAPDLARFKLLQKRIAMLAEGDQAWLKSLAKDGRIHGVCWPFGTVTGRCNHFKPNLGQVPAAYSPFGKECRELFEVEIGFKLVGTDADGLEARMKAHYLYPHDGGALVDTILNGKKSEKTDIHNLNVARLGYTGKFARDHAKTWYYAFMYGAGNEKLGKQAMENDAYKDYQGDPKALGAKLRKRFEAEFTGLGDLTAGVKKAAKRGWLKGLAGKRIPIRAIHSSLNSLFQSGGGIVMKKALVIADQLLKEFKLVPFGEGGDDYEWVLNVHDEYQNEIKEQYTEFAARVQADAIRLAGEYFNLRCPLKGSSDIGDNWKETH